MEEKEMEWQYIKCEREIIDFCLDRMNACNIREYHEDGSYKPTNADILLDYYLKQMLEDKLALVYTHIKDSIEVLIKSGCKVTCPEYFHNVILRLMGVTGEGENDVKEYINYINKLGSVKELLL